MNYALKLTVIPGEKRLCQQVDSSRGFLQTRMKPSMAFKGLQKASGRTHLLTDRQRTPGIGVKLILLLIFTYSFSAQAATLRFQAQIHSNASLLGDIVQITNDSHHWSSLALQSHPQPGELITKEKIINWMNDHLGEFDYAWQGKTQVRVEQKIQSCSQSLVEKAHADLVKKMQPDYTHVTIVVISHPKAQKYPIEHFKSNIELPFPAPKRICVWLSYKEKRIPIWFKVKAYARVLVATHDLSARVLLKATDFSWEDSDIAGLSDKPASDVPNHGWLLKPLKKGNPLLSAYWKPSPQVQKGERIKVCVTHHRIRIIMEAEALKDGYLGDIITVKNQVNQKILTAVVTDFHQAEIRS